MRDHDLPPVEAGVEREQICEASEKKNSARHESQRQRDLADDQPT